MDTITRFALGAIIAPSVYFVAYFVGVGLGLLLKRLTHALRTLRRVGRRNLLQGTALRRRELFQNTLCGRTRRIERELPRLGL